MRKEKAIGHAKTLLKKPPAMSAKQRFALNYCVLIAIKAKDRRKFRRPTITSKKTNKRARKHGQNCKAKTKEQVKKQALLHYYNTLTLYVHVCTVSVVTIFLHFFVFLFFLCVVVTIFCVVTVRSS